jgi:RNA polymerase sigma factor (sigma-70 family)
MPKASLGDILHFLRWRVCDTRSDVDLLHRFASQREDAAFSVLVERHAPMVMSVCKRVLGEHHAAEDAFQAVFFVLAQRAATIRLHRPLGAWLYAVAQRVALDARAKTRSRRNRERQLQSMPQADRLDEQTWRELRSILDEEIGRLSEKDRAPIVLCYLEEKSQDEAARELGCAKGTVARRLERGRELLRRQLIRRGITLSAGALATALCENAAGSPVAALLTLNSIKGALSVDGGAAVAAGYLSAPALALAQKALSRLSCIKGKLIAVVLALALAAGGIGWASYGAFATKSPPSDTDLHAEEQQASIPEKKRDPTAKDQYGDPLPQGAIARLGAAHFRHEGTCTDLAFTPDGKTLVGHTQSGVAFGTLLPAMRSDVCLCLAERLGLAPPNPGTAAYACLWTDARSPSLKENQCEIRLSKVRQAFGTCPQARKRAIFPYPRWTRLCLQAASGESFAITFSLF